MCEAMVFRYWTAESIGQRSLREGEQARAADEHRQLIPPPGRIEKAPWIEEITLDAEGDQGSWGSRGRALGTEGPSRGPQKPPLQLVQALMGSFVRNLPHAEEAATQKEQKEQQSRLM